MDKFVRRTIVTIVLVTVVAVVVYRSPLWLYSAVAAVFIGFTQFEFFRMAENRNIFVYKYFGTVVGSFVPVVIYIGCGFPHLRNLEPFLIIIASLFVFVLQLVRKDARGDHLVSVAVTVFSIFYISWFFSFFVRLRFLENGASLVAFLVIVVKGADIGAYLGGSRFGRNLLMPRISPNKTTEGVISGIILSVVLAAVVGPILTGFTAIHAALLGAFLATLGQIGDLAESLIKRDCNVKDSGPYLADIGGVFDLIDSLLFSVPIFYYYVKMFK